MLETCFLMASSFLSKYKVIFRSAMVIVAIGASDKVGRNGVIVPWNDHKWSWGLCYYYGVYYEYDGGARFFNLYKKQDSPRPPPNFCLKRLAWDQWPSEAVLRCTTETWTSAFSDLRLLAHWKRLLPGVAKCWVATWIPVLLGQVTFLKRFSQFSMVSSPVLLVFHKVLTDTLETDPPQIMRNSAVMTWGRPWKMPPMDFELEMDGKEGESHLPF